MCFQKEEMHYHLAYSITVLSKIQPTLKKEEMRVWGGDSYIYME